MTIRHSPMKFQKKLETNTQCYYIDNILCEGGSGIVYEAHTVNNMGNSQYILIKEFYPAELIPLLDRVGDELVYKNDRNIKINADKQASAEYEMLKEIVFDKNGKWDSDFLKVLDHFEANNTCYTVLEAAKGKMLSDYVLDQSKIEDWDWICRIIAHLIYLEKKLVSKGYLHMDISPDNIFVSGLDPDEKNTPYLIDYNSAICIKDPDRIAEDSVSVKRYYTAPELQDIQTICSDEKFREAVNPHADIYSMTAVFFELLDGSAPVQAINSDVLTVNGEHAELHKKMNAFFKNGMNEDPNQRFDKDPIKALDVMAEAMSEIINLLEQAYPLFNEMNQKLDKIVNHLEVPKEAVLTNIVPATVNGYLLRHDSEEDEYRDIIDAFKRDRIVFCSGISGFGKSEYCKAFAKYAFKNKLYTCVSYVTYTDSIKQIIASVQFENFDKKDLAIDDLLAEKQRLLGHLDDKNLLIIDNCNVILKQKDYDILDTGAYHVLITTQYENQSHGVVLPLDNMSLNQLILLFKKQRFGREADNIPLSDKNIRDIRKIINAVGAHTMAISVIAAATRENDLTIEEMAEKIESGLPVDLEEVVEFYKDREQHEKTLVQIFKMLFDISWCTEQQKRILQLVSLIPVEGISYKLFKKWAGISLKSELKNFETRNWIRILYSDRDSTVVCHSLVAMTIHEILPISRENALNVLCAILETIDAIDQEHASFYEKRLIALTAYNTTCNMTVDAETDLMIMSAAHYLIENEYFSQASTILENLIAYRKQQYDNDKTNKNLYCLNEALLEKCKACYKSNKVSEAMDLFKKIQIFDNSGIKEDVRYLIQNISYCENYCWALSQFEEKYPEAEKWYDYADTIIPQDESTIIQIPELLKSVGKLNYNRGVFLFNNAKYDEAIEKLDKSIEYGTIAYGEGSLRLCSAKNQLAAIKNRIGDIPGSYMLYNEILAQRLYYYGRSTRLVANSCGQTAKIGLRYLDSLMKEGCSDETRDDLLRKAEKNFKLCLDLRKSYFNPEHNLVGDAYNIQYMLYSRLWQFAQNSDDKAQYSYKAEEGFRLAREIFSAKGLINESQTYENEGDWIMLTTSDVDKAKKAYDTAKNIAIKKLDPGNERIRRIEDKIEALENISVKPHQVK